MTVHDTGFVVAFRATSGKGKGVIPMFPAPALRINICPRPAQPPNIKASNMQSWYMLNGHADAIRLQYLICPCHPQWKLSMNTCIVQLIQVSSKSHLLIANRCHTVMVNVCELRLHVSCQRRKFQEGPALCLPQMNPNSTSSIVLQGCSSAFGMERTLQRCKRAVDVC